MAMVRIISLALLMSLVAAETATAAQSTTPPAGAIQSASTAVDGTLAALIAELERSNPEIQAAKSEVDARTARIAPAGALPDPTLSFSTMTGFSRPPFFPASTTPNAFN